MPQEVSTSTRPSRLGKPLAGWSTPPAAAPADPDASKSSLKDQAVIVLIGLIVFCTNLGSTALFDMDEALYGTCAREMAQRGDWVVPWFNGRMFPDKPPLMFWLMMLGRAVLGPTELAVRLHSAIFGIATALATYHLGRLLFRREVGFWAGVIVSTSIIFTVSARAATVDSALTFTITAAMAVLVGAAPAWRRSGQPASTDQGFTPFLPRGWPTFVLMYALIAVAVLAKGPVGLIMPIGAIGLFLLMVDRLQIQPGTDGPITGRIARAGRWLAARAAPLRMITPWWLLRAAIWLQPMLTWWRRFTPARLVRAGWRLRPITALVIVGAIALPWYVLVGLRTDGRWLQGFMAMNLGPAAKAIQGHSGPWFYHLLVVFIGFFPWAVFIGPMLIEAVRRVRGGHPWRPGYVLVMCWATAVIGLWSVVAMKLPHHILPAYPALALLAAAFVYTWITQQASMNRWWMRNAAITLVVVGVGLMIALPIVAAILLPGEGWIGLAGVPLIVGGAWCWWFSERARPRPAMAAFAISSVAFLTFGFGIAALGVDRHQNGRPLAAELRKASDGPLELASFRFFRESFVYYTGTHVERIHKEEDLDAFVRRSKHPFIITTDEHAPMIRQRFNGRFHVLNRQQRFLDTRELVVLQWQPSEASRIAAKPPERLAR